MSRRWFYEGLRLRLTLADLGPADEGQQRQNGENPMVPPPALSIRSFKPPKQASPIHLAAAFFSGNPGPQ